MEMLEGAETILLELSFWMLAVLSGLSQPAHTGKNIQRSALLLLAFSRREYSRKRRLYEASAQNLSHVAVFF